MQWREYWLPPETGEALARGDLMHKVLELHYTKLKEGMKLPGVVQEVQTSGLLFDPETAASTERQDLVAWMYGGYTERWGADEDWEIVAVEFPVSAMLPTGRGTRSSFRFTGKVDLMLRERGMQGIWIADHKTGKNLPKKKDLDMEDQMPLYIWALRRQGIDVRGCIYNSLRTQKLVREMTMDERYGRIPMARTDIELETVAVEAYRLMKEAYQWKPGGLDQPRSPDSDRCSWRCPFTEPCLASRKGGDRIEMLEDTGFRVDLETSRGSRNPAEEGAESVVRP